MCPAPQACSRELRGSHGLHCAPEPAFESSRARPAGSAAVHLGEPGLHLTHQPPKPIPGLQAGEPRRLQNPATPLQPSWALLLASTAGPQPTPTRTRTQERSPSECPLREQGPDHSVAAALDTTGNKPQPPPASWWLECRLQLISRPACGVFHCFTPKLMPDSSAGSISAEGNRSWGQRWLPDKTGEFLSEDSYLDSPREGDA